MEPAPEVFEGRYRFKLYVAGRSPRSDAAVRNIRRLCRERLGGDCRIEVVDVAERPDVAEAARILSTPTLDKEAPPPLRRVIGDLSDSERLALALGLFLEADLEAPGGLP